MIDPTFRASVRPVLTEAAAQLVAIYEATPGSTGPGCCPEALAAVLEHLGTPISDPTAATLQMLAAELRGDMEAKP